MLKEIRTWEAMIEGAVSELRVAGHTASESLAVAIVKSTAEGKRVVLSCIGVQAVHQAMKAVAICNGETAVQGKITVAIPTFQLKKLDNPRREGDDGTVTALRIIVSVIPLVL